MSATGTLLRSTKRVLRRRIVEPFDRQLVRELESEIVGRCETLLDLGCGRSSPIGQISAKPPHCVGVDLFEPYLRDSVAAGIHTDYLCLDVMEIERHVGPSSFDCVVALDLIEHLPEVRGFRLLELMERVARRKVIVFTPNGFVSQAPYDGNPFQEHLSGWTVDTMLGLGYRVIGLHGWKPLRRELGVARLRPRAVGELLALWSQPFVRQRPEHAFHLLCVKDLAHV